MPSIYQPSEDSYLLSEILKQELPNLLEKNPDLRFLEIGAGSGIHLETAFTSGVKRENIFSGDINQKAVDHCSLLGFHCIHSDLFQKIGGKFDLIIFNPPYLPDDKNEPADSKLATTGGVKGSEIINEFLVQAKKHLKKDGKIFLIISSLTKDLRFTGYKKKEIGCEKMFFETLCVLELTV
jgi:release factor glutamine methyltransferase